MIFNAAICKSTLAFTALAWSSTLTNSLEQILPWGKVGNKCSIWVSLWSMRCLCHWILMRWWAIASVYEWIIYMNHCCHHGEYIKEKNSWRRRGFIIRSIWLCVSLCACFHGCVYVRMFMCFVCVREYAGQLDIPFFFFFFAVACNILLSKIEKSQMGRTFACKWTGSHRQHVTHLV